jgi:hypothetical protein
MIQMMKFFKQGVGLFIVGPRGTCSLALRSKGYVRLHSWDPRGK